MSYKYRIWPTWNEKETEFNSILEALDKGRVFSFEPDNDGTIRIVEGCDDFFCIDKVTVDELYDLADEIRNYAQSLETKQEAK